MKIKWILLALLLSSCSEFESPGEVLQILTSHLEEAHLEENYNLGLQVTGGLRPYHFELEDGQIPEGLQLDDNGRIFGIANVEGNYEFTITVSDANLSKTFQKLSLRVTEAPSAQLAIIVPLTEMREPFTVRVEVKDARNFQAFRTVLKWDKTRFEFVPDSLRRNKSKVAIFEETTKESLQIDLAVLGESLNGNHRMFEFDLKPRNPNTIRIISETEFLSSGGNHSFRDLEVGSQDSEDDDSEDDNEDQDDHPLTTSN